MFREALHLNSLEDFNATGEIKDKILSIWKAKDKCKTSSLRPTFVLLPAGASKKKKSTLGATFSPSSATAPVPICQSHFTGLRYAVGGVQLPLQSPWIHHQGSLIPWYLCPTGRVFTPLQDMSHGDQSWNITLIP